MQVSSLQETRPRFTWKTTPAGEGDRVHRLPRVGARGQAAEPPKEPALRALARQGIPLRVKVQTWTQL